MTTDLYRVTRLAASAQLNGTDAVHIVGILLVGGTANSSVTITEDADGSGTAALVVKALANDSQLFDLVLLGGKNLTQAYVTLDGTAAEVYIFWE